MAGVLVARVIVVILIPPSISPDRFFGLFAWSDHISNETKVQTTCTSKKGSTGGKMTGLSCFSRQDALWLTVHPSLGHEVEI